MIVDVAAFNADKWSVTVKTMKRKEKENKKYPKQFQQPPLHIHEYQIYNLSFEHERYFNLGNYPFFYARSSFLFLLRNTNNGRKQYSIK